MKKIIFVLKDILKYKKGGVTMIKVSELAAEKFEEAKQKSNKSESTMLRISYGGYG